MRRRYIDLCVSPNVDHALLRHLGWKAVAFCAEDLKTTMKLPRGALSSGLEAFRRLTVRGPPTRSQLAKARRLAEVVSLEPLSVEQARMAAKGGLVDVISLPAGPECFNEGVASLMKLNNVFLELRLLPLIEASCSPHLLTKYRRWYYTASEAGVEVVFSTGASSTLQARSPRDLASLASLITLSLDRARDSLSVIPSSIIERGVRRLDRGYVMPGVRVVEEG